MKLTVTISVSKAMEIVFFLEVLDMVLNVVFASQGMSSLASLTVAASYILTVCLLVLLFLQKSTYDYKIFLPYVGIIMVSLLSVLLSDGTLSFSYFRKWLIFFSTFTLFFWAVHVRISSRMIAYLKYAAVFLGCYFCVLFATGKTYPLGSVGITFNLGNPNFTGMWLLSEALLLASFVPGEKSLIKRAFFIALIAALVYFILLTNARACIVAFAVFFLTSMFFRNWLAKPILFAEIIFPLAFAIIYMQVVESDWFNKLFSFMVSEGKGLNSRVKIWERGFEYFLKSPIWGDYYAATGGSGLGQLHNNYVDTLAAYGGIVLVLILSFLFEIVNQIIRNGIGKAEYTALYAFGAVLISGTFEAGLFSSSQGMFVLVAGLLLLARLNHYWEIADAKR